jgi:serine/threonine protein kinase
MEPGTPRQPSDTSPGDREAEEEPTDLLIRIDPAEISASALPVIDGEHVAPGTMLGEYRLEGLIGKGGMGFVYAAVHPLIGKRAAVKILRRELCREPLSIERFINEARIVNRIGHPNIVDVFAFGRTADGGSYFVMEWLKGESLRARVARSRLPADEIRAIVKALASALSAAHAEGVIHRDLKPDNVFLVSVPGQGTVVKLLDFGVAKLERTHHQVEQTASGAIIGTPQYIAPEQAKSQAIDPRADTYALGAILFELITGRPPFLADSAMEVVAMHLMEPPPRPSEFALVPPEIDDLVVAMLAKSPDERPAMDEITARFERARWGPAPLPAPSRLEAPPFTVPPRATSGGPPAATAEPDAAATLHDTTLQLAAAHLRPGTLVLLASCLAVALAIIIVLLVVRPGAEPLADTAPGREAASPGPVAADPRGAPAGPPAAPADGSAATAPRKLDGAAPTPAPGPGAEAGGSSPQIKPPRPGPPAPRPPVAAPAPAARTLRLVVGAADFVAKVDGKRVGPSTELASGKHHLRVCARGKRLYEREFEIASSDVTWRVELEPLRDDDLQCRE